MFVWISAIAFLILCLIGVVAVIHWYDSFDRPHKIFLGILILLFVIFVVFSNVGSYYNDKCTKVVNTSILEFEEIYKVTDSDDTTSYYIKTDDDEFLRIDSATISKGDDNYVIITEYPNMTETMESLLMEESIHYTIVVEDTNIKDFPKVK